MYSTSSLTTQIHTIYSGDVCYTIGTSGSATQIFMPVTGTSYYSLGWVKTSDLAEKTYDSVFNQYCPIKAYPCATSDFDVMESDYITVSGEIWTDDYCTIEEVYADGWCKVTYPAGSTYKTAYTLLSNFVYNVDYNQVSYKATSQIDVYSTKSLSSDLNWWISSGDTFYVVSEYGTKSQVFYPIDEAYGGGYKLGWISTSNLPKTTYTVTYNANGGTNAPSSQTKTHAVDLTLTSSVPTRTGYTFVGWATSSTATTCSYYASSVYSANESIILYPVWSETYIVSLEVYTLPDKTIYNTGESFDDTGLSVLATYNDGTTQILTSGIGWMAPYQFTTAGEQTISILNNGVYASFSVTVIGVESISIETLPDKLTYNHLESLDTSGLSLNVVYTDGSSEIKTGGFTRYIEGYGASSLGGSTFIDLSTLGETTIIVDYQGFTTSYVVDVIFEVVEEDDSETANYVITSATATAGSEVVVYIGIENNPGIISLRHYISYDTDVLELVEVEDLGLLNGYTTPSPDVDSPYILRWADSLATVNSTVTGNYVKLTFKIKDDAQVGTYDLIVTHIESRDWTGNKIEFTGASSTVTVIDYMTGDVDGDGEISDWDAILLTRYLAGWNVDIVQAASDLDGDDEVSDWDAIVLARYLAGWNITLN